MALDRLFTKLLIIFISVSSGDVSDSIITSELESRPMQQPRSDLELLESIDDDLFEELMKELPIMRQVLVGDRKKKTLRVNASALGRYVAPASAPYVPLGRRAARAPRTPRGSRTPARPRYVTQDARRKRTRKQAWNRRLNWRYYYPQLISCYACGLNESMLPTSTLCHDMFDSDIARAHALARFFRARCFYYDKNQYYDRIYPTNLYFPPFFRYDGWIDPAMRMDYFGPYMDGCVKRYVDVGPLYTQRACRGRFQPWRPYYPNHAAHRLSRLEIIARGHGDVCVHSPHASLTPFSRAVSLFVRYHVCVCENPYCNRSSLHRAPLFTLLFYIVSYVK